MPPESASSFATLLVREAKAKLRGALIPVITNLDGDLELDLDAVRSNVHHLVEHGIVEGTGVFLAAGAGGDFPMLTVDERKRVAAAIIAAADGRTPVLVGAQDSDPRVSVELARFAESEGAYGIQLSPPYYYAPSTGDALRWFQMVHDATSRIAIMAYNTHWHFLDMPLDLIWQLCELERLVGLKWSTPGGGGAYVRGIAEFRDRLAIVDNHGHPVECYLYGGTGFVTHLATVWPEGELAFIAMIERGDYAAAFNYHRNTRLRWSEFRGKVHRRTGGEANVVKAALEIVGRPGGPGRPPTDDLTAAERTELRELLAGLGAPVAVAIA